MSDKPTVFETYTDWQLKYDQQVAESCAWLEIVWSSGAGAPAAN